MSSEDGTPPVSDVDRANAFYLTPPGSGCSIIFGEGVTSASPGSCAGLQLSVYDLDAARAELIQEIKTGSRADEQRL